MSMDDDQFSLYDQYDAPPDIKSSEQASKIAPTLKSVNNRKKGKEMSAREKAILFAKNVPKPKQ